MPANHWRKRQALDAAAIIADTLASTLSRYKTRASAGPRVAAACLAATIADGLVAVIHVLDSHGQAHAPTLARGMIESMLDLELVCANHDNIDPLRLVTAQGKIVAGQEYLAKATMLPTEQRRVVAADLKKNAALVEKLKRAGVKPLDIKTKFKKAPNSASLWTFYWLYCSSAHSDLRALAARHLRADHIVLGTTLDDDDVRETLSICSAMALNVYEYAPIFLMVSADELRPEWEPLQLLLRQIVGRE